MSTLTATVLPNLAAVRLELGGIDNGPVSIMRTDRNGVQSVRQLPDQAASSNQLAVVDYELALAGTVRYDAQVVQAPRTNVLPNPSFETDTTGWTATGGLVAARETAGGAQGPALAYLSGNTAVNALFYNTTTTAAAPGQTWTGSAYVKGTPGDVVSINVASYDAAGGNRAGSYVPFTLDGTWQRVSVTAVTPALTAGLRFILSLPKVGQQLRVDGILLEQSATVQPYIEGTVIGATQQLAATVTLATAAPVVSIPVRPQQRYALAADRSALIDYDEGSSSGTIRHDVLGATSPILILRPLQAREGTFTFRLPSYPDAKALRAVLAGADVVLVRQPTYDGMDAYVGIQSVSIQPIQDSSPPAWSLAAKYAETDPPAGGLLGAAAWTIADVVALGVTIGQLPASFPTVYRLAVGP